MRFGPKNADEDHVKRVMENRGQIAGEIAHYMAALQLVKQVTGFWKLKSDAYLATAKRKGEHLELRTDIPEAQMYGSATRALVICGLLISDFVDRIVTRLPRYHAYVKSPNREEAAAKIMKAMQEALNRLPASEPRQRVPTKADMFICLDGQIRKRAAPIPSKAMRDMFIANSYAGLASYLGEQLMSTHEAMHANYEAFERYLSITLAKPSKIFGGHVGCDNESMPTRLGTSHSLTSGRTMHIVVRDIAASVAQQQEKQAVAHASMDLIFVNSILGCTSSIAQMVMNHALIEVVYAEPPSAEAAKLALELSVQDGAHMCFACTVSPVEDSRVTLSECGGCGGLAMYCSVKCQRAHYKQHKPFCQAAAAATAAVEKAADELFARTIAAADAAKAAVLEKAGLLTK